MNTSMYERDQEWSSGGWKYVNESDHEWMMDMRVNNGYEKENINIYEGWRMEEKDINIYMRMYKRRNMRPHKRDEWCECGYECKYVNMWGMNEWTNINVGMWI